MANGLDGIITRSSEASQGGFRSINTVRGKLVGIKREDPKEAMNGFGKANPDVAIISLEDVTILAMDNNEDAPELTENKYTIRMNYAPKGQTKPSANGFFVKGFVHSAEEFLKKQGNPTGGLGDLMDKYVILGKDWVELFKMPAKDGEDLAEITANNNDRNKWELETKDDKTTKHFCQRDFVFKESAEQAVGNINEIVKGLIMGKTKQAAVRELMLDQRTKGNSALRDKVNTEAICVELGLELKDNMFVVKGL